MDYEDNQIVNYYYITGTSRGIGKALAEEALKDEISFVYGISRSCTIENPNYKHVYLDLTNITTVEAFNFEKHDKAERIVLVNNSGMLGEVKHTGKLNNKSIIDAYNVNLISPSILINKFIAKYKHNTSSKVILNVSSGAGKYPVDAWSIYCSSKAGLDMFTKVVETEQLLSGLGFKILSVAPGVVDTQMQEELRNSDANEFSRLDYFVEYKKNNQLTDPKHVAVKFLEIISNPDLMKETVFSVRDFEARMKEK